MLKIKLPARLGFADATARTRPIHLWLVETEHVGSFLPPRYSCKRKQEER